MSYSRRMNDLIEKLDDVERDARDWEKTIENVRRLRKALIECVYNHDLV